MKRKQREPMRLNDWQWYLVLMVFVWLIILSTGLYASWRNDAHKKECESVAHATFVPHGLNGKCMKEISIE